VRFAYVTSVCVEEKQTHIQCKPKALPMQELRQRATMYCHWEIMDRCHLICFPPPPPITLQFAYNGRGTHRFAPTTVRLGCKMAERTVGFLTHLVTPPTPALIRSHHSALLIFFIVVSVTSAVNLWNVTVSVCTRVSQMKTVKLR
jgi:hypothetical protein